MHLKKHFKLKNKYKKQPNTLNETRQRLINIFVTKTETFPIWPKVMFKQGFLEEKSQGIAVVTMFLLMPQQGLMRFLKQIGDLEVCYFWRFVRVGA